MSDTTTAIHVRFSPDAQIVSIGDCPEGASLQAWFDLLSEQAGGSYEPLSGGRGLFRVATDRLAELQSACPGAGA